MLATSVTGPLVWIGFIGVGVVGWIARRRKLRAEEQSIEGWAASHGYPQTDVVLGRTPVLSAVGGDPGPAFAVPIGDRTGALFPFSYTIGAGRDSKDVDTTVVQVDAPPGVPPFRVVPREGSDVPDRTYGEEEMELESIEFQRDHQLLVERGADRTALERLFDPPTIVWFINQGSAAPVVEYADATLAVVARSCCMTGTDCEALLGQAQYLTTRLDAVAAAPLPDSPTTA